MNRPIITAKVGNLKKDGWIDIYADGWLIGTIWGTGKAKYIGDDELLLGIYLLRLNDTNVFLYVDIIKRRVEAVEPIKQEAVSGGS